MMQGTMTALVTPFRDGAVDYDALSALVEWQIEAGIEGLIAVGTTGESPTLTMKEHKAVIQHVAQVANKRVPVIGGAGANATALVELVAPGGDKPTPAGDVSLDYRIVPYVAGK